MVKAEQYLEICRKCKAECCKIGGPNFTEKEMKNVLKKGHKNYFFEVRDKIYELKSKKDRCPYLKKDNSCEIQNVKPLLCLCWPVLPDFKNWKKTYILIECPLTKVLTKNEIEKCKKEASKISKKMMDIALDYSTIPKKEAEKLEKKFKKFKRRRLKCP